MVQPDNKIEEFDFGEVFFQWHIHEHDEHYRDVTWYLIATGISFVLLIYSIYTANFLFALIIILAIFIVFLKDYYKDYRRNFQITEDGILIGNQFFEYERIKNFYIIYTPPGIKKVFFRIKGFYLEDVSIPLYDNNPLPIREKLLEYIKEDVHTEHASFSDIINTIFKL